jgi:hypothetical protein
MQKKIIVSIIIIILLLVAGGVYYWWWGSQEKEPSLEPVDYIQIKETPEGKIVENTKEGVSMKVPEGWEVELPTNKENPVNFYIFGAIEDEKEYVCKITSVIREDFSATLDELQKELQAQHTEIYTINRDEFIETEIAGQKTLKNILDTAEGGYAVSIYIIFNNKLYIFSVMSNSQNAEKCSQEFDKFLETVSIK